MQAGRSTELNRLLDGSTGHTLTISLDTKLLIPTSIACGLRLLREIIHPRAAAGFVCPYVSEFIALVALVATHPDKFSL